MRTNHILHLFYWIQFNSGDSLSSLDECSIKRFKSNDTPIEFNINFNECPCSNESKIEDIFGLFIQDQSPGLQQNVIKIFEYFVKYKLENELKKWMLLLQHQMNKHLRYFNFDSIFNILMANDFNHADALKLLLSIIQNFVQKEKGFDFITRKICKTNDDMLSYLNELKQIKNSGYGFQAITINALMEYALEKYNVEFYGFVLEIVNKLNPDQLNDLNEEKLNRFFKRIWVQSFKSSRFYDISRRQWKQMNQHHSYLIFFLFIFNNCYFIYSLILLIRYFWWKFKHYNGRRPLNSIHYLSEIRNTK